MKTRIVRLLLALTLLLTVSQLPTHAASTSGTAFIEPAAPSAPVGSGPQITVPPSTEPMALDGECGTLEYNNATVVHFTIQSGGIFSDVTVLVKHTTSDLYVCFVNMPLPQNGSAGFAGVYIDRANDGGAPDSEDFGIIVHPNGQPSAGYWNDATQLFNGADPGGWSAASSVCNELCEWIFAEFRISRQVLGGWKHNIGLSFFYHWFRFYGDDYAWPANNVWANPQVWGSAKLLTGEITINESTLVPVLDGACNGGVGGEYSDAAVTSFTKGASGGVVDVFVKHTATDLYACFTNLAVPAAGMRNGPNAAIYLNRTGTGGDNPTFDDMAFSIAYDGTGRANRGDGSGYGGPAPGGYSVARQQLSGHWTAEFRISAVTLGGGWSRSIDLAFATQWINFVGDDAGWPTGYYYASPASWGAAWLSSLPTATGVDLQPASIEVTQSIQDSNNSVLLVADKRTFVRVHVATNSNQAGVSARLAGFRNGLSLGPPLMPLNPAGVINVITLPSRSVFNDSFLFELPASWITSAGPITLRADINPFHAIAENDFNNNSLTSQPLSFVSTPALNLVSVNYQYWRANGSLVAARNLDMAMLESELRRMYPISALNVRRVDFVRAGLFVGNCPNFPWICIDDNPNAVNVNADLAGLRPVYGFPTVIHGLVFDRGDNGTSLGSGFMRGMGTAGVASSPTGPGTWSWDFDGTYGDWYGAHEIGHALWRNHTSGGCGEGSPFQDYPRPEARLGTDFFGFDVGDSVLSLPRALMPGSIWRDVMSYCAPIWISDVTYAGLNYSLRTGLPLAHRAGSSGPLDQAPMATGDFLSVNGFIDLPHQVAALPLVRRLSEVPLVPSLTAGPYHIRLFNASNGLLSDHPFTPTVASELPNVGVIDQVVDFEAGTRRIAIFSDSAAAEIASVAVSANAPAVVITSRSGGSSLPASGPVTITRKCPRRSSRRTLWHLPSRGAS